MAGFFGLFDYSKPGPGVQKNGPQKKSFVIFFEIFFRKFWKLITVNLLYVLVSLPLLTVGLANAGLTYVTRNFAREKHAFISGDFFGTVKKNWKQALAVGIINLLVTVIVGFDIWFFFTSSFKGIMGYVLMAVILSVALVFTFMKYYVYMLLITFKLSVKQIYKNSLIFAMAGLGRNLLIFIIEILCYAAGGMLIYLFPAVGIPVVIFMYILLYPAFRSLLIQFIIFPLIKKHMIDPYYRDHPDEDKTAKQALNILDEDERDDEDKVFVDTIPTEEEPKAPKTFPRQYSQDEMQRLRKHQKSHRQANDDDDGTI